MPRFRKNSHLSAALQVGMASAIMDLAIKESMMTEPDKKPVDMVAIDKFYAPEPWVHQHLTKAERLGKTKTELDELRQLKWGELHAPIIPLEVKNGSN